MSKPRISTLKPRVTTQAKTRLAVMQPGSWRTSATTTTERGYDWAWKRRRARHLSEYPLCAYCLREGRATVATVCDHIVPHRGDRALFDGPIQSLCASCHSSVKAKEESRDA